MNFEPKKRDRQRRNRFVHLCSHFISVPGFFRDDARCPMDPPRRRFRLWLLFHKEAPMGKGGDTQTTSAFGGLRPWLEGGLQKE